LVTISQNSCTALDNPFNLKVTIIISTFEHGSRKHDCLKDMMDDYRNCSMMCSTIIPRDIHTHDQFLQVTLGLFFSFSELHEWYMQKMPMQ